MVSDMVRGVIVHGARVAAATAAVLGTGLPWAGRDPRRWQIDAVDTVIRAFREGIRAPLVHACTGSGKSTVVAELAARCTGTVLVTTPTQALVRQLGDTLAERSPSEVGRCYQHAWEPDRRIVVTCNASLGALLAERPGWACWIADEAHKIEGDGLRLDSAIIRRKVAVGLTATPFRSDTKGLQTWDKLVYSYTSAQAVADGVLVPWRAVRRRAADTDDTDALVEQWVHSSDGPGIVSAVNIADAESYADRLGATTARAIHQRCSISERERRIDALRTGEIRCLVHVQLLTEGIDLPWLRWLAMRRPVSSPVRLVQEVGRVLRAHPGKTEAVLYDPNNLLDELGLVHAAALEDAQRQSVGAETDVWSIPELEGLDQIARLPPAIAVSALEGWAIDVLGALRGAGIAPPPGPHEGGGWRQKRATDKQRSALARIAWAARYLPDPAHRAAVRWLAGQDILRSGTASNLIDVLRALASASAAARQARMSYRLPISIPGVAP